MSAAITPPESPAADAPARRRSFLPRFGLRALFVFAIAFCLASAWVGKNAHRMRQEETAIAALERAGVKVELRLDPGIDDRTSDGYVRYDDAVGRLIGWRAGPTVRSVELFGFDPSDPDLVAALSSLRIFPEIRALALSGPGIDDDSLLHMQELSQLESVSLRYTKVTGAGVSRLGPPLHVRRVEISDAGLNGLVAGVATLTEVREVAVRDSFVSSDDVEALSSLPRLESIRFHEVVWVEPGAYKSLATAKGLKRLSFEDASCREGDLAAIAKLPELEFLEIVPISDTGLAHLASLTKLRGITISGPSIEDAAMQFSAEHPGCVVRDSRFGGYDYYLDGERVEASSLPPLQWPSEAF